MSDYNDFFVVIEQTSDPDIHIDRVEESRDNDGLHFLRFRACLQSFGERNRNGRLWIGKYVRDSLASSTNTELMEKGYPGENGHPVPTVGQPTIERILTIDPNNISHIFKSFEWVGGDRYLYSIVETLDDINGPGAKFANHIKQGIEPAFSCRALVPQRKNRDGTTDVTGSGRVVTFDRIILPSHKEAYRDISIPIKEITVKDKFDRVMESCVNYVLDKSKKVEEILENFYPILESATVDSTGAMFVETERHGKIIIPTEKDISREISTYMRKF